MPNKARPVAFCAVRTNPIELLRLVLLLLTVMVADQASADTT
jgi:hypothetical protein